MHTILGTVSCMRHDVRKTVALAVCSSMEAWLGREIQCHDAEERVDWLRANIDITGKLLGTHCLVKAKVSSFAKVYT